MSVSYPTPGKTAREEAARLLADRRDFAGTYMLVANLEFLFHRHPETGCRQMIAGLHSVLSGPEHAARRQAEKRYPKHHHPHRSSSGRF